MFYNQFLLSITKKRSGFSLVEMLVSIAAFMILITILVSIYVAFTRNQTRAKISQNMINSLQYTLEVVSRQIRDNNIVTFSDVCPIYLYTGSCIILEREDGGLFAFTYYDNALDYALINDDGGGAYSVMSEPGSVVHLLSPETNNISVDLLKFYIQPNTNPYLQDGPNQQPKVTIVLQATYSGSVNVDVKYNFQTTVSSRIYKR